MRTQLAVILLTSAFLLLLLQKSVGDENREQKELVRFPTAAISPLIHHLSVGHRGGRGCGRNRTTTAVPPAPPVPTGAATATTGAIVPRSGAAPTAATSSG
ncbi:uncharacterized protein LOC119668276 [Teleopsis dalmanni]|uniref:uncharacterized protein LOC119668276 n=1 Tax=Teleopsis dalmanni TaxID=139649 RepID=UPI0018CCC9F3|nr:uncharacterized protein LOC119668276 [Teleopsis dalmanni]